jgi:hypothetical protein
MISKGLQRYNAFRSALSEYYRESIGKVPSNTWIQRKYKFYKKKLKIVPDKFLVNSIGEEEEKKRDKKKKERKLDEILITPVQWFNFPVLGDFGNGLKPDDEVSIDNGDVSGSDILPVSGLKAWYSANSSNIRQEVKLESPPPEYVLESKEYDKRNDKYFLRYVLTFKSGSGVNRGEKGRKGKRQDVLSDKEIELEKDRIRERVAEYERDRERAILERERVGLEKAKTVERLLDKGLSFKEIKELLG